MPERDHFELSPDDAEIRMFSRLLNEFFRRSEVPDLSNGVHSPPSNTVAALVGPPSGGTLSRRVFRQLDEDWFFSASERTLSNGVSRQSNAASEPTSPTSERTMSNGVFRQSNAASETTWPTSERTMSNGVSRQSNAASVSGPPSSPTSERTMSNGVSRQSNAASEPTRPTSERTMSNGISRQSNATSVSAPPSNPMSERTMYNGVSGQSNAAPAPAPLDPASTTRNANYNDSQNHPAFPFLPHQILPAGNAPVDEPDDCFLVYEPISPQGSLTIRRSPGNEYSGEAGGGDGEMNYEEMIELQERIGFVSTGVSHEVVGALLSKQTHLSSTDNDGVCCICQEEYREGEETANLECEHKFHFECIRQWLSKKNSCPVCRRIGLNVGITNG